MTNEQTTRPVNPSNSGPTPRRKLLATLVILIGGLPISAGCRTTQTAHTIDGALAPSVEGQWESVDCVPAPQPDGSTSYLRRSFRFQGTQWGLVLRSFASSDCTAPTMQIDVNGVLSIEGPSSQVPEAFDARFGRNVVDLTAMSPDVAALLEANRCGDGRWQVGQPQSVARGCLFLPPVADCPAEYDLIRRRDDQLWFGARAGSLCTPSGRPVALDEHAVLRMKTVTP